VPRYYDLDVALKGMRPPVKRRFLLRAEATLAELHGALRDAFGWSGSKAFETWSAEAGVALPAGASGLDPTRVALAELLGDARRSLVVVYDPDAWWEHVVTLKRTRESFDEARRRLIGGRGAAPPENCGGLAGFEAWRAAGGAVPEVDFDDLRSTFDL
jgi:hypothetical protein